MEFLKLEEAGKKMEQKLAVISDVHGNYKALEAVIACCGRKE